jgi:cytochrome P450
MRPIVHPPSHTAALYPPIAKPAARAAPLLLFLARFVRNPLRSLPRAVYDDKIVAYGGERPLVVWVTDPALIETVLIKSPELFPKTRLDKRVLKPVVGDGLLTAEGDTWRWQRKLASPLFRHTEILNYVPVMVAATRQRLDLWRSAGGVRRIEIEEEMTETTFSVISRTILAGIDEQDGEEVKRAGRAYLDPITWEIAAALLLLPETWWHPGKRRMKRAAAQERAAVQRLLDRRRQLQGGDDLVGRMLAARNPETGEPMSDAQLIDNLATFLLAGHETTAKALTWTLYLLARSPEWQERVRAEVNAVTGGAPVGPEHVAKLEITQRVLKESMRLYPPVPVLTRVNAQDLELGGMALKAPTLIVIPVYAVHRHHKTWADPDLFDPDRFLPDREALFARAQFMPFGAGPRICIGSAFAMIEATAILATVLQAATFAWDGRHLPEPLSRVTLRPKGGMPLDVSML